MTITFSLKQGQTRTTSGPIPVRLKIAGAVEAHKQMEVIRFILVPIQINLNGCGIGPLLVLVSPCFRETVVITCKIRFVLSCSLDNLLQKNVIVSFF